VRSVELIVPNFAESRLMFVSLLVFLENSVHSFLTENLLHFHWLLSKIYFEAQYI